MRTRPPVGASRPAMIFRIVVLPQPLGPSRVKNSPGAIVSDRPATVAPPPAWAPE
jgi:hypothetical protein